MNALKTAVVGVGRLGASHARWLSAIENCKLVGVYDIDQSRCESVSRDFKVKAFDSLAETLSACEALCIATPTVSHHEVAIEALNAGVHTLIEKPIAATLEQAREIGACAKANDKVVSVGHIERFNPAFLAVAGRDMRPRFIEAHRLAGFNPRSTDIAVILDLMVHDIDLALALIKSKPSNIAASAVPVITDLADIANVRIQFENGAVANLTASRISLQPMRKMRIFERSGYYSLDFSSKSADLYSMSDGEDSSDGMRVPLGDSGKEIVYRKQALRADEDMLKMELESFIASAQGIAAPAVSADEGIAALEVALEVERVATAGRLLEEA